MPPNDSYFWKLATYVVAGGMFCAVMAIGFKNGMTTENIIGLVSALAGVGALHGVQAFAPKSDPKP